MSEDKTVEKSQETKKKGFCGACPKNCKYPICLIVVAVLILWFLYTRFF